MTPDPLEGLGGKLRSSSSSPSSSSDPLAGINEKSRGKQAKNILETAKHLMKERDFGRALSAANNPHVSVITKDNLKFEIRKSWQQSITQELTISNARKYIAEHKAELEKLELNPSFMLFNLDLTGLLLDDKYEEAIDLLNAALKTGKVAGKDIKKLEKAQLLSMLARVLAIKAQSATGKIEDAVSELEKIIKDHKITAKGKEYKLDPVKDKKVLDQLKKNKFSFEMASAKEKKVEAAKALLTPDIKTLLGNDEYAEQELELEYQEIEEKQGIEEAYKKTVSDEARLKAVMGETGSRRFVEQLKVECLMEGIVVPGVSGTGPKAAAAYIKQNKINFLKTADEGGRYRFSEKEIGKLLLQARAKTNQFNKEKSYLSLGCVRDKSLSAIVNKKTRAEILKRLKKEGFIDLYGRVTPKFLKGGLATSDGLLTMLKETIEPVLYFARAKYLGIKDYGMQVDKQIELAGLNETLDLMRPKDALAKIKEPEIKSFLLKSINRERYEMMRLQFTVNAAITSTDPKEATEKKINEAGALIKDPMTITLFLKNIDKDKFAALMGLVNKGEWEKSLVLASSWRGTIGEKQIEKAFSYIRMRQALEDVTLSVAVRGLPSQFEPFKNNQELKVENKDIVFRGGRDEKGTSVYIADLQRMLSAVTDEQGNYYLMGQEGTDWKWGEMNAATAVAMYRFLAREGQGSANLDMLVKAAKKEVAEAERLKKQKDQRRTIPIGWSGKNLRDLKAAFLRSARLPQTIDIPLGSTPLGLKIKLEGKAAGAGKAFFKTGFLLAMVFYLQDTLKEEKNPGAAEKLNRLKAWVEQGKQPKEEDLQWFYDKASTVEFDAVNIKKVVSKTKDVKAGLKNLPYVFKNGATISLEDKSSYKPLNWALLGSDLGKAVVERFKLSKKADPTLQFEIVHFIYCVIEYMIKTDPANEKAYRRILQALTSISAGDSSATLADYKLLGEKIAEANLDQGLIGRIIDGWKPESHTINPGKIPRVWMLPDGSFRLLENPAEEAAPAKIETMTSYQLQTRHPLSLWAQSYVREGGKLFSYDQNNFTLPRYLGGKDFLAMAEHEDKRPLTNYVHYPIVMDPALGKFLYSALKASADPKIKNIFERLLAGRTRIILEREKTRLEGNKGRSPDEEKILSRIGSLLEDEENMEARIEAIIRQEGAGTSSEIPLPVKQFFKNIRKEQDKIQKKKHISPTEYAELRKLFPKVPQQLIKNFRAMLKSISPDYAGGFSKEQIKDIKALGEYLKANNRTVDSKSLKKLAKTEGNPANLPGLELDAIRGARVIWERVETLGTQAIMETGKESYEFAQTFRNLGLNGKPERGRIMALKLEWARANRFDERVAVLRKRYFELSVQLKDPKDITKEKLSEFSLVRAELDYYLGLVDSDEITADFLGWLSAPSVRSVAGNNKFSETVDGISLLAYENGGKYLADTYKEYVDNQFYIDSVTKKKMGPRDAAELVAKLSPRLKDICPQWLQMGRLFSLDATVEGGITDPKKAQELKSFKQALAFLINIKADNKRLPKMNGGKNVYGEKLNGLLGALNNYYGKKLKGQEKGFGAYIDFVYNRQGIGKFSRGHIEIAISMVERMPFAGKDQLIAELKALRDDKAAFDGGGNLIFDPGSVSKALGFETGTLWSTPQEKVLIKLYRVLYGLGSESQIPDPVLSSNPSSGGIAGVTDGKPGVLYSFGIPFFEKDWRSAVYDGISKHTWDNALSEIGGVRFLAQQIMLRYLMILNIYYDLPAQVIEDVRHGNYKSVVGLLGLVLWTRVAFMWYRDLWEELSSEKPNYAKCLAIYMAVNFLTMQRGWDSTWGTTIRPLNETLKLLKRVPGFEKLISKIFNKAEELQKSNKPKARWLGKILEQGLLRGSLEGKWKDGFEKSNPRAGKYLRNITRLFLNPIGFILQNDILFNDGRVAVSEIKKEVEGFFIKDEDGKNARFREGLTEDDIKAADNKALHDLWKESHRDWWDYSKLVRSLMDNNSRYAPVRWSAKTAGFTLGHVGTAGWELFGMGLDFAKRGIGFPFSWGANLVSTRSPIIVRQLRQAGTSLHINPTDILAGVEISSRGKVRGKIFGKAKVVAKEGGVDANAKLKKIVRAAVKGRGPLAQYWKKDLGEFRVNPRISSVRVIKGQKGNFYRKIGDGTAVLYLGEDYDTADVTIKAQDITSTRAKEENESIKNDSKPQEYHDKILDGSGRKERAAQIRRGEANLSDADKELAKICSEHENATGHKLRHVQLQSLMLLEEGMTDEKGRAITNILLQVATGEGKSYLTFYAAMRDLEIRTAEWIKKGKKGPKPKAYLLTTDDVLVGKADQDFREFQQVFKKRNLKVGFRYQNSKDPMKTYRDCDIIVVNVAQHAFDLTSHASEIPPGTLIGDEFDFFALETAATSYIQSMRKGQTGNPVIDRVALSRLRGKWAKAKSVFEKMLKSLEMPEFFEGRQLSEKGIAFIKKEMGGYDYFVQMQFKALMEAQQLIIEKGLQGQPAEGETELSQSKKFKVTYRDTLTGKEYTQEEVFTDAKLTKKVAHSRAEAFVKGKLVPIKIVPIEDSGAESPDKSYGRGVDEALRVLLGMNIEAEHITAADINISEVFRHHSRGGGRIIGWSGSIGESASAVQNLFPELNFGVVNVRSFVPRVVIVLKDITDRDGKIDRLKLTSKLKALAEGIKESVELKDYDPKTNVFAKLVVKGADDKQIKEIEEAWNELLAGKGNEELEGKKVSLVRSNRYFIRDKAERFKAINAEAIDISGKGQPVLICVEGPEAAQQLIKSLKAQGKKVNFLVQKAGDPGAFTRAMKMAGEARTISITYFSRGLDLWIDQLSDKIKLSSTAIVKGGLHVISVGAQTRAKALQQIGRGGRSIFPGSASEYFGEGDLAYGLLDKGTKEKLSKINGRVDLDTASDAAKTARAASDEAYYRLYNKNYAAIKKNFKDSEERAELMRKIRSLRGHRGNRRALARAAIEGTLDYLFKELEIKDGESLIEKKRGELESKLEKLLGGRKIKIDIGPRTIDVMALKEVITGRLLEVFGKLRQGDPGADQKVKLGDGTERLLFELKLEEKISDANGEISLTLENLAHEGYSKQSAEDAKQEMARYADRRTAGLFNSIMAENLFPKWSLPNAVRPGTHTFFAIEITAADYNAAVPAAVIEAPVQTAGPVQISMVSEKWDKLEKGEGVVSRARGKNRVVVKYEGEYYVFPLGTSGLDYEFKDGKHVFSKQDGSKSTFDSTEVLILSVQSNRSSILGENLICESANVSRRAPRANVGGMGLGGLSVDRVLTITGPAAPIAENIAPGIKRMPDGTVVIDGELTTLEKALENPEIKDTDIVHFNGKEKIKVLLKRSEVVDYLGGRARYLSLKSEILDQEILKELDAFIDEQLKGKRFPDKVVFKASDGTEVKITKADLILMKKAAKAREGAIKRALKRDKGAHSRQDVMVKVLYALEQGTDLNRSIPVSEYKGTKADMRTDLLEMKIKVKPRPRSRSSSKPVAEVEVSLLRKDLQILMIAPKDTKEYAEALERVKKAIRDKKIEGVSVDEVVQKQLDEIEQAKKQALIHEGQGYFEEAAKQEGDKVLRAELARIDSGKLIPEETSEAFKKAIITARKAMMTHYQRSFELLLDAANKKDSTELSAGEVERVFNGIAAKSSEQPVPQGEEWEKQIEETRVRINEKLKAINPEGKGVAAYFEAIHLGAPGASAKVKMKIVGASMARGFLLGAAVGDLTVALSEAVRAGWKDGSFWSGTKAFGNSFLVHKFAHARGFIKFEAMNTAAKLFLGLDKFWAQAAAIGLPQMWELKNMSYEQRGVAGIAGGANLGTFFAASYGTGAILKRLIGAAPLPWWQKAVMTGLPLLVGQKSGEYVSQKVMELYASSETARFFMDNTVTRSAFTVAGLNFTPSLVYAACNRYLFRWLSFELAKWTTRFATGAAAFGAVYFYNANGDFNTNIFHGDIGSLAAGKYFRARVSDDMVFKPKNIDFSKMPPRLEPVYWQLAVLLRKKGLLTEEKIYQTVFSSMMAFERVQNYTMAQSNGGYKLQREAKEFARALISTLSGKGGEKDFKLFSGLFRDNRQYEPLFLKEMKGAVRKFQAEATAKGVLVDETLSPAVRKDLREAYVEFRVAEEKRRYSYFAGEARKHAAKVYFLSRRFIGPALKKAFLAKTDRSDQVAVIVAKKQAESLAYSMKKENAAILSEEDRKEYFGFLSKEHKVKKEDLPKYLKKYNFIKKYADFYLKVKVYREMTAKYLTPAGRSELQDEFAQYLLRRGNKEVLAFNGVPMFLQDNYESFLKQRLDSMFHDNSEKVKAEAQKAAASLGKSFEEFSRSYNLSSTKHCDEKYNNCSVTPAPKWFLSDLSKAESLAFRAFLKKEFKEEMSVQPGETTIGPGTVRLLLRQ